MTADLACQELVELVTDYLDGALAPDLAASIDAHIADCPGCHSFLDQMRATMRLLGRLPTAEVEQMPAAMRTALHAAYHAT
jgi:anti-sigma factor RsiW